MNASGFASLDRMIERLRGLEGFPEACARAGAPLVQLEAKRTAAAGTTPEGAPWAPRKRDGGRALKNAAAHVTAVARGAIISIVLRGADVWHQYSTETKRQVIPEGGGSAGLPAGIRRALERGAELAFAAMMGRSSS